MQEKLQQLAEIWISYKIQIIEFVGLTNDAMHVHASFLILLGSAVILRRRPDSIWCWLMVLALEVFNEFADFQGQAPGEANFEAATHDLYNTMFWPTVILIMGRFFFPPRQKQAQAATISSDFADQAFEQPATV